MNDDAAEGVTTEPKTASRWEDYIDVYFSPAELFRRRAADRVAPPLIALLVLAILFYVVLLPANKLAMRAAMQAQADPAAAAAMEQMGSIFQIIGAVTVPIMYLIVIATTAALLWLVGRFSEVRIDFGRAMLIGTYGGFIYLLAQIAGSVAVLIHGADGLDVIRDMSFGILRFVGDSDMNASLIAVLRRFEVFAIWQAVVWSIGIREIYRTSTARAFTVGFVTWLLFVIPGIIGGFFQGMGGSPPPGAG